MHMIYKKHHDNRRTIQVREDFYFLFRFFFHVKTPLNATQTYTYIFF